MKTTRATAAKRCPGCGARVEHDHEVGRAARRREYCNDRCRRRLHRNRHFDQRFSQFSSPMGTDTGAGTKAPCKPLKSRAENSPKPDPTLFVKPPLNLLGTAFRWPGAALDPITTSKIVAREIGGSVIESVNASDATRPAP
jgi:hypothetical protein